MYVYAGIDEAGYGPMFGPLLVGRAVLTIPKLASDAPPPYLWQRLSKAVCRNLAGRNGRIAVNDSKKLRTAAAGIKHLELGCLAFAGLGGHQPATLDAWLDCLGESCHADPGLAHLPWYHPSADHPWNVLPLAATAGEVAIARSLLRHTAGRIGVELGDLGAAVVFEDRFNTMCANTRSKAATNFTFVARHLRHVWDTYGQHHPFAAVDRQSGRSRYRSLLALSFPEAAIRIIDESDTRSAYHLTAGDRAMTVRFEVEAEQAHMPVALASMIAKYTRELFMARFNAWFTQRLPSIAPTAGYATDAQRFWQELSPHLDRLGIDQQLLRRRV